MGCITRLSFAAIRRLMVLVLMRNESGYMMLLLSLPFHQHKTSKHFSIFQSWIKT